MFRVVRNLRKYANDEAQGVAAVKRRASGFFTASEAAHRLGHCRETVARAMDLGGIPYIRLARRRYIRAETLEAMKAPRFIERIFAEITNALGTNV
jgi:excisionase family DNA binding protein